MKKLSAAVGALPFASIGAAVIVILFFFRVPLKEAAENFFKPKLPEPQEAFQFLPMPPKQTKPSGVPIEAPKPPISILAPVQYLESINLRVPFGSQAPLGNWDLPYQEACEEAAVIMVERYFKNLPLDAQTMKGEIDKLVEWQEKTFGYYKDTTAAEMARILREYFKFQDVEVRYGITIEDIKAEVKAGRPVILPAAGRLLPNPYFRQPGPLYHALVVKGFMPDGKVITNDPGTRRGEDFLYDPKALIDAVHDWDPKDILQGAKAMVVVKK